VPFRVLDHVRFESCVRPIQITKLSFVMYILRASLTLFCINQGTLVNHSVALSSQEVHFAAHAKLLIHGSSLLGQRAEREIRSRRWRKKPLEMAQEAVTAAETKK
jgi:hypothetical protein